MVGGSMNRKHVTIMLKKILLFLLRTTFMHDGEDFNKGVGSFALQKDVKKGHFVVHAIDDDDKRRRFIVELSYLSNPGFVKLLDQTEEEFGFEQGVLAVHCRHSDLERILENKNEY